VKFKNVGESFLKLELEKYCPNFGVCENYVLYLNWRANKNKYGLIR